MIKIVLAGAAWSVSSIGGAGALGAGLALASGDCCGWLAGVCCALGLPCC